MPIKPWHDDEAADRTQPPAEAPAVPQLKRCCICGAILVEHKCTSCLHRECVACTVYVEQPTREELQSRLDAATAMLDARMTEIHNLETAHNRLRADLEAAVAEVQTLKAERDTWKNTAEITSEANRILCSEREVMKTERDEALRKCERLSAPVSGEEWNRCRMTPSGMVTRLRVSNMLAARAQEQTPKAAADERYIERMCEEPEKW